MSSPPARDGIGPARLRLPATWSGNTPTATIVSFLLQRFPDDPGKVLAKVHDGDVLLPTGEPVSVHTPYATASFIYIYRDPPVEHRIPFELELLYRDDAIVVVDKPHFLATTPRGGFVAETALVRLRRTLQLPGLVPAHRLDRLTAGVLLFTVRPADRHPYHALFASRNAHKSYEAIGRHRPELSWPRTVRSRIIKDRKVLTAAEIPGAANSETYVELAETRGSWARYLLRPHTGKTHQLRVHLNSLGAPIAGDPLYPEVLPAGPDDYANPLRLLARSLSFTDPLTGAQHTFTSQRQLDWPGHAS